MWSRCEGHLALHCPSVDLTQSRLYVWLNLIVRGKCSVHVYVCIHLHASAVCMRANHSWMPCFECRHIGEIFMQEWSWEQDFWKSQSIHHNFMLTGNCNKWSGFENYRVHMNLYKDSLQAPNMVRDLRYLKSLIWSVYVLVEVAFKQVRADLWCPSKATYSVWQTLVGDHFFSR